MPRSNKNKTVFQVRSLFSCSSETAAVSFHQRNLWSPNAEPGPQSSQVPHVSNGWSMENKMLRRCLPITSLYQIKGLKAHFPFSCWRKLHRFRRAETSSWPGGNRKDEDGFWRVWLRLSSCSEALFTSPWMKRDPFATSQSRGSCYKSRHFCYSCRSAILPQGDAITLRKLKKST